MKISQHLIAAIALLTAMSSLAASSFQTNFALPTLDRWMYAHNAQSGDRVTASIYGSLSATADTRNAQFLVGFSTSNAIPAGLAQTNYLVRSVRFIATIDRGDAFVYDPTHDIYNTYQATNAVDYLPDTDPGRPIELFGVGFRGGFTAATYEENSSYGTNVVSGRLAYAQSYDTNGLWVDVSNNARKTNSFAAIPFAVGTNNSLTAGQLVPVDAPFYFNLNLDDPMVLSYVQNALRDGVLPLIVSSLHTATQGGAQTYPSFYNKENLFGGAPAQLEIIGTVISALDSDADQIPDDWEQFYFANLNSSATEDNDSDGSNNLAEYIAGTDPSRATGAFKVTSTRCSQNGNSVVEFTIAAGRTYEIAWSDDLTNWLVVSNPTLRFTAPGVAQWIDDGSQTGGSGARRFYRINVK